MYSFFQIDVEDIKVRQFLLRGDYGSRGNPCLEDWLRNLNGRAASK
jgi:hypothetical protein